jgi:hypothetical protein
MSIEYDFMFLLSNKDITKEKKRMVKVTSHLPVRLDRMERKKTLGRT